jgi:hypothetical protein
MTESQEEIQTQDTQPIDAPQDMLDTLRAENEGLKASLADAQAATDDRQDSEGLLREAQTENLQLRSRLSATAAHTAVSQAAEQLGVPATVAQMHAHKFRCDIGADGEPTVTPDPVEYFESEMKRDPTMRTAVDDLAAHRRSTAATVGAVDLEKTDPVELLASLDRNPIRKSRFIARHGVKAYLKICDRARRC